MAEWIGDGYDFSCVVRGVSFEYRPLTTFLYAQHTRRVVQNDAVLPGCIKDRLISGNCAGFETEDLIQLWSFVSGFQMREFLQVELQNLKTCLPVYLRHPHLSRVTCDQCRYWWYDIETGQVAKFGNHCLKREGITACEGETSDCPIGHWSNQRRLSIRNLAAYRHFLECDATGEFPDDPIVKMNAVIIRREVAKCQKI